MVNQNGGLKYTFHFLMRWQLGQKEKKNLI